MKVILGLSYFSHLYVVTNRTFLGKLAYDPSILELSEETLNEVLPGPFVRSSLDIAFVFRVSPCTATLVRHFSDKPGD